MEALSPKEISRYVRQFVEQLPHFDARQKEIIQQRIPAIVSLAKLNLGCTLPADQAELEQLCANIKDNLFSVGSHLQLNLPEDGSTAPAAILHGLMCSKFPHQPSSKLTKAKFLEAFLIRKNDHWLKQLRVLIGKLLLQIPQQLSGNKEIYLNALAGYLLAYYSFMDPQPDETLSVPLHLDEGWKIISYKIGRIPLTPKWLGSQVYAYGLTPINGEGPPILLFKGTSYPADDGFYLGLMADFNPCASVGSYLFSLGKAKIKEWLSSAERRAYVFGQSLGGTLCAHTVAAYPDLVAKCFTYNAPPLFIEDLKHYEEKCKKGGHWPNVYAFYNENDIVPLAGACWGKNWRIFRVLTSQVKNPLVSHVQCFLNDRTNIVFEVAREKEQTKFSRKILLILYSLFCIPFFLFLAFLRLIYSIVHGFIFLIFKKS